MLLLLAACTQPSVPTVGVVVAPTTGETGVPVDTVVSATFNAAMNESTLDDVFTLSTEAGPVAGTQAYDATERRLTFTPDADLEYDTEYTAAIERTARSTAGGRLVGTSSAPFSWTFTTEVEPSGVTSITVAPDPASIELGGSVQLTATVEADEGIDDSVTWSSSDEAVATVSDAGLVSAVAAGTAAITATSVFDGTVSGSATVTVLAPAVTAVDVTPAPSSVIIGETVQLEADVAAVSGASLDVTWSSSDETVATVDQDGLVTGVTLGAATITATSVATPSVSGSSELTVTDVPAVTGVTLDPPTLELELGESATLTPGVDAVGGADESVTWASSDDTVATVDADGVVTAVAVGTATITATSVFDVTVEGTADVTVLAEAVTGVTVDPAEVTIEVGDADVQFTATVDTVSGASEDVTWTSSDPSVAAVDAEGLVSAVAAGTATITATSVVDAAVSGAATVNVPGVTDVDVTPASADLILTGSVQLVAVATAVHGETDESVTWSSSDAAVATVSETGLVSAVATGSVTITATSVATPSTSGTATIDVYSEVVAVDYVTDVGYATGEVATVAAPTVSGGLAPYTFALSTGALPDGMDLAGDGSITGTPTTAGTYTGTVTVTDDLNQSATAEFEVVIAETLAVNVYDSDVLEVDTALAPLQLIAAGGLAPFTFTVITVDPADPQWSDRFGVVWSPHAIDEQGPLAPGLVINDVGEVSGTVTTVGFHRTYVQTTDAIGQTDVTQLEIDVNPAPLTLSYASSTYQYANGTVDVLAAAGDVEVAGGVLPYTFTWARTACSTDPGCSDAFWGIDPTNGEIARSNGGADNSLAANNGDRTYDVTVTDDSGATVTFSVIFEEE